MKTKLVMLSSICLLMFNVKTNSQSLPGEIAGTVTDESGAPLPYAVISYRINGNLRGTTADENGHYRLKPLDVGKYDIIYSLTGFDSLAYKDVNVSSGQITMLSVKLLTNNTLPGITIVDYVGLFDKDETMRVEKLDAVQIKNSVARDPRELVALTSQANQRDDGKDINIRGSRSDATQYYIDGVKMIGGFSIPKSAIKEIAVISGGIPAMFGDATGGIVLITTKSFWDK